MNMILQKRSWIVKKTTCKNTQIISSLNSKINPQNYWKGRFVLYPRSSSKSPVNRNIFILIVFFLIVWLRCNNALFLCFHCFHLHDSKIATKQNSYHTSVFYVSESFSHWIFLQAMCCHLTFFTEDWHNCFTFLISWCVGRFQLSGLTPFFCFILQINSYLIFCSLVLQICGYKYLWRWYLSCSHRRLAPITNHLTISDGNNKESIKILCPVSKFSSATSFGWASEYDKFLMLV